MIDAYICEDNKNILKLLKNEIEKYILIQNYDIEIKGNYSNPNDFIDNLKNINQRSIYFLDIDYNGFEVNGFDLGKEIRKRDARGFIIYITSFDNLLMETFKYRLEALDYIIKDAEGNFIKQVVGVIDSVIERLNNEPVSESKYYSVNIFDTVHKIPYDEILYFETSEKAHRIILYTTESSYEFFGKIKEIEVELGDDFYKSHRSILVNRSKIKALDKKYRVLELETGIKCPISRSKIRGKENQLLRGNDGSLSLI
ncbi:LytR/AlgR family response regulator transcription factor [Miniphocaeibacter massiliensis]|uniref:LytR/AlgR family response regulator transcription factor n=1 Tax=Miniphocaeibacter massiliensis TaxID=2041841 RepID=UPI000C1B92CD|nr:LytTR family DNA-binding domain-containing protein [Miniphocaeibacter massiliensis]